MNEVSEIELKSAVDFHGHICPGLAMGYRVARYVREHYSRSEDEELVCIAENRSCSVDAVQAILGCTAGKGNLIIKDHGKQVFTVYSRDKGKAWRIYFKGDVLEGMDRLRKGYFQGTLLDAEKREFERLRGEVMEKILTAPYEEMLSVEEVAIPEPEKAKIYPSLRCQECGEAFMEIMGRAALGKVVCQECYERMVA